MTEGISPRQRVWLIEHFGPVEGEVMTTDPMNRTATVRTSFGTEIYDYNRLYSTYKDMLDYFVRNANRLEF